MFSFTIKFSHMMHYICTGECGGVADKPGICQAENCPKSGEPLEECECTDGQHDGRMENDSEEEEEG